MMKFTIFACLAAVALASPQFGRARQLRQGRQFVQQQLPQQTVRATARPIAILRDDREDLGNGEFRYSFESENGISESRSGYRGSVGQVNMEGTYSFPLPDGTFAEFRFIADEGGYRAESPLIPTPPPMPAHALEQIRFAEEQRARGVVWDEQGFVTNFRN